jgi:hypothetical protein
MSITSQRHTYVFYFTQIEQKNPIPFQKWGVNSSLPIFSPAWVKGYVVRLTQGTEGGP